MPADVWNKRHRFLVGLTWFHAGIIALVGPVCGYSWEMSFEALLGDGMVLHTFGEGLIVAVFALLASSRGWSRTVRASLVGFGLISSSAILVHLSGGYIELHFHFFVMLVFLALYQDWVPYSLAVLYVAIHHGVVGVIWPWEVYNHPAAINAPWTWAGIHAFFVLCSSVGSIIAWRFTEAATAQTKLILDSAGEGIYGVDLDGKATFVNPAAAEMLDYKPDELIGRGLHEVIHHSHPDGTAYPRDECPIYAAFKDGTVHRMTEEVFWRKDDKSFPVDYVSTPIFERGELTGAVVTFRDVTQRQQRDKALRESDARKRAILESALDAIITIDHEGRIIEFNPAAERTFGYSRSDVVGKVMADLIIPPSLRQAHNRGLAHYLATGQGPVLGKRIELTAIRADGAEFLAELTITPIDTGRRPIFTGFIRDITEHRRAEERIQARYKELETLHEMGQIILRSPDLKTVAEKILSQTLSILSLDLGVIRLLDAAAGALKPVAIQGFRDPKKVRVHQIGDATTGNSFNRVMGLKEPMVIENVPDWNGVRTLKGEGVQSAIVVPMRTEEEVLGVIQLGSKTPRKFQPDEIRLLEAIGNQMGVAAQKAQLLEEAERRAREQVALNVIATATTQSLDIDTLMQTALETTIDVLGVHAGRLYVFDGKINALRLAAHWGISEDQLRGIGHYAPGEGVIGRIFVENRPYVFADVETDPNYQAMARGKLAQRGGYRSVAGLPITVKDRPIGVIYVYGRLPRNFTQEEMGLLSTIGGQIGVALENARLFEESQKNLRRIRALREIDQAISSTLDLRNVLDVLMEKIDLVLPYSATTVRLFNQKSGLLEPIACRNLDEKEWKAERWKGGRGIPNVVFETKAPWTVSNVQTDPSVRDAEFFRKHGLVSYLGVPLVVKDEILGVLSFYTKEEHEYTGEEIEFLTTLTGQAAIAIHNSQLYEDARLREAQLQETNRMLSALHAVAAAASRSLDLDRVLQAAIEKIRDIFGFDATRIHIYNEQTDELLLRASLEIDPDRFTTARSFKRGNGIVGKVAESGKALVFEDIQTDPLYKQVSQIKLLPQFGYHFLAVFPIKGRMKNLGTVTCVGNAPRKLSSGEVQLIEALADQIAVAIENSGLYENVRQKVQELQQKTAELERANQVKDEFLSVMSHELRTPLNVIVGYSDMIKDGMLGEVNSEQRFALEKVMSHTYDLLTMITGILYATSIEAHQVQMDLHRFALGDFLNELRTAYDISRSKPLTLIWDYPSNLPAVETDKEKLKHILQNLIHNAIKFTAAGQVTISARIKGNRGQRLTGSDQGLENGGKEKLIEFRVTDTGIGVPKEKLPIIFEKFRQADSSETRPYGGVGLGLYIAKNFTELLGGKIEVETQVGKGSTFTVTIPMASREGANGELAQEKRREFIDDALTASGLPPERG